MKMKAFSRISIPAVVVVAALALTGCSTIIGGGKTKPEEEGPLQKYMSALYGGEEQDQEFFDKQQAEVEDLIAECMTKEGFEYKPNTPNGGGVVNLGEEEDGPEWGSVKFAETYGYGIIDWPGMDDMQDQEDQGEYIDPNQDYLDKLTESERQAYYETLNGPQPTEEELAEMDPEEGMEYDWKTAGCYGAAQHEVQGDAEGAYEDPEFKALFEQMDEMYAETYGNGDGGSANEDMVKLDRKWAECMTAAGYDFPSPQEAQNALYEEWNEAQSAGSSSTGESKEPSKEVQKKFQATEIKTAVADAKCQEKINYRDEQLKVSNEIEQKFVDEHKAELDAMLAKYDSKKKEK